MNRKLLNGLLVLAVAAGGVGTFTSCKDENFENSVALKQSGLEAQIAAIRAVEDKEFQEKLQGWIDSMTDTYSDGDYADYGFANYYELVQCAAAMNEIYQNVINNTIDDSENTKKYVENLYDWMFENKISASDWYDLIYRLAERASSVEVNQTYNPMFGSINLPIGLQTTVLASYVVSGTDADGYEFPNSAYLHQSDASPLNLQANQTLLTTIQNLGAAQYEVNAGAYTCVEGLNYGNMGAVYATINPASNNFTSEKYTISLVDSKGEELAGVDVAAQINQDELAFGFTRADEATGIYKLNINAEEGEYAGKTIDLESDAHDFAADLKAFIKDKSVGQLANLGKALYDKINLSLPAYGVQVAWEENVVDQETGVATGTITNKVISNLEIAAAAIHPLSYGTDLQYAIDGSHLSDHPLPVWSSLDEVLNKIDNKLTLDMSEVESVDYLEPFDLTVEIEKSEAGNGYVYFKWYNQATGEYEEVGLFFDPEGVIDNSSDEAIKNLTTFVNQILAAAGHELAGDINKDVIAELNKSIDAINDALSQYNAKVGSFTDYVREHKAYGYAEKLYDFYAKAAEKYNKFIKDANHYLQVWALYKDMQGNMGPLSSRQMAPTVVTLTGDSDDALKVYASSYTGDIAVPSYLKYVAITEYNGQPATKEVNAKAGEYVNKVFPGQGHGVPVKLGDFNKGDKLTITYISVDYSGVCSAQNYYIILQ